MTRILSLLTMVFLSGCQYYCVTDRESGTEYYTNNWLSSRSEWTGTMYLQDIGTGEEVLLHDPKVQRVVADDVRVATRKRTLWPNSGE